MTREGAPSGGGQDGKVLLQDIDDQDHTKYNKSGDGASVAPRPLAASHCEGQEKADPDASAKDAADEVDGSQPVSDADTLYRMDGRKVEEEGRSQDSANDQIDVEGPAPGCRGRGKGPADDGSQNGPEAPEYADEGHVEAAFLLRGHDCIIL